MKRRIVPSRALLSAVLAAGAAASIAGAGPAASRPAPFVRIHDTGRRLQDLRIDGEIRLDPVWATVAHKKLAHAFAGDAVIANDKVVLAVCSDGPMAAVFAAGDGRRHSRAALVPGSGADELRPLAALKIVENAAAAAAVEMVRKGEKGATDATRLRVTMGSPLVEVRHVRGADSLLVCCFDAEHFVACDYFAGDVVWTPGAGGPAVMVPPIDNVFLALHDGGRALAACMWKSRRQEARAVVSPEAPLVAEGVDVDLRAGQSVWVAVLERQDIWQRRKVVADGEGVRLSDAPAPPFAARWRCSAIRPGKAGLSWALGEPVPAEARPGEQVVIYPLERIRRTPLTALCVTDLMRRALGVGPCRYVLDAEGLAGEAPATADDVTRWLSRLIERGRAKEQAAGIGRRLAAMKAHFAAADARIGEYLDAARALRTRCTERGGEPPLKELSRALVGILDETIAEASACSKASPSAEATRLADELAGLVGREGAAERSAGVCKRLRALGAGQARVLGRCRQGLRRVRAFCRGYALSADAGPEVGKFALGIRDRAGEAMKPKGK